MLAHTNFVLVTLFLVASYNPSSISILQSNNMTEFVVESVLHNLSTLEEFKPFGVFHPELRGLARMLTTIKASLEDAEEKQFSDQDVKNWLRKINGAVNMVDDIIDEFAYEDLVDLVGESRSDKVQLCLSIIPNIVFGFKMAGKLNRINERLIKVVKEKNKFQLSEIGMIAGRIQTTIFFRKPRVYGREEDKNRLLNYLNGLEDDLSIYPIEGPDGIGKTTFVKLIYDHPWVVNNFELRIWACGFSDFSLKGMIEAIIKAALGCDCENLDLELVPKQLQYLLQKKRYLLVLDFVLYSEDQNYDTFQYNWQKLKSVLACGGKGASILVTTRLSIVSEIMGTVPPHKFCKLSELSHNDCWKLFKRQVFEKNEPKPSELAVIGKEIVQNCRGVPLAAKVLGGLLHFSREEKQWLNVKESSIWSLPHAENSIVTPALILSYLNLPIRLKKCFAYCAIFPKGETITKAYLIELWMTNGFISSYDTLNVKEVGDDVWNELYRRSFFQDIEIDEFGNITGFKMHDLVIDLATFVAKDIECVIGDSRVTYSSAISHLSDYRRRIELNSIGLQQIKSLRTYLIPNQYSDKLFSNVLKCQYLRVLQLRLKRELSPSIGDLKHLRYLNLSKSDFKTLPEILCKLWNLQILKLDYCKHLQKLPHSLTDLRYLEKLSFKGSHKLSSLPPQMGKLSSLRSLTSYFVGNERGFRLGELGGMSLRGDLEMKHLGRVKSVEDAMEAKMSGKRLKELRLSWDRNEETKLGEDVEEILEVLRPDTQQLVSLTVTGYRGGRFPRWVFSGSLKKLEIERCRELKGLQEGLESMTALQWLRLYDLPNLESLPDCFQQLSSLRRLAIGFCCKLMSLPNSLRDKRLERLDIYACPALEDLLCDCSTSLSVCQLRVDGRLILNKVKEGLYPCQI